MAGDQAAPTERTTGIMSRVVRSFALVGGEDGAVLVSEHVP